MDNTRPILYGVADYAELRKANAWFIDRTAKIRDLEATRYAMFLRPRRFGKSLLASILEAYYDVRYADRFDEFFSGTMMYSTTFDVGPSGIANTVLSLGEVREIARVRLNGRDLGVRFMPPYEFPIPAGLLRPKGNALEVEVTNLGANRLRWNDINKVDWKYFCDINIVGSNYKPFDASKWKPLKSGLLGPVEVR